MNPMPPLEPMLKQLRLSGILESLEARNRQAIESKLAYTDFLALLIADEIARRDQRQFAQRLRRAQVMTDKTIERFDMAHNPSVNAALIAELATCRFVAEHAPVLIAGPTGTGKSHWVQALGHCALRAGFEVLFITHEPSCSLNYTPPVPPTPMSESLPNWPRSKSSPSTISACARCAHPRMRISTT